MMETTVLPELAFDLSLEHGRCVGVRLPGGLEAVSALARRALLAEEQAFAAGLASGRRPTWVGGRVALREALARSGIEAPAVLPDDRGAPALPPGIAASISHKDWLAVALAATGTARVGVDIEADVGPKIDIASKVLTGGELAELAGLDESARSREVLLRFSAKEAVYKALDPFVRRYVAFDEVTVAPRPDGSAGVRLDLRGGEGPFAIDVRWLRWEGFFLTTARAARRVPP